MDDITKAISMDVKKAGSMLYLVGITKDELGGSQYYKMKSFLGNNVPRVDPVYGKRLMQALTKAIGNGCVRSCHDCSEGGFAVTLAEMAFAGGFGMSIHLGAYERPGKQKLLNNEALLFSESNTRFVVEVADERAFSRIMRGMPIWKLGYVRNDDAFRIFDTDERPIIDTGIDKLKAAWQKPFGRL
jgi:phosphoribosylformylglycinamidine synthase